MGNDDILKSKEELLAQMQAHLDRQEAFALRKYQQALDAEEDGETDLNINRKTKKENTALKEYNMMVSAVNQTIGSIIRIQNSKIPSEGEEEEMVADAEEEEEELV